MIYSYNQNVRNTQKYTQKNTDKTCYKHPYSGRRGQKYIK